jgi:transcription termination/antitermination protein NusG
MLAGNAKIGSRLLVNKWRSWRSFAYRGANRMKNWVILFVRTGLEEKIARVLKERLSVDEYLPFLPTKETPRRSRGVIYKECKLLFPGYIFIKTGIGADSIAEKLKSAIAGIVCRKDIYSILHYGDDEKDVVMREQERLYWERLFDPNFCITGSIGFIEGDVIRITSGALVGMESRIKLVNRHKREAVVEMEIMGAIRKVMVMLEVVVKA